MIVDDIVSKLKSIDTNKLIETRDKIGLIATI